MKKVMITFGTRPEAIKLLPLVQVLKADGSFDVKVVVTAQHRDMLDQVLSVFKIIPDIDLDLMTPNQSLETITARVVERMGSVFGDIRPDLLFVQGDTTTTMATALAAFYHRIPVGHVEAGLRSFDMYNPFPEEVNRKIASQLTTFHFAPTERARKNLLLENVPDNHIHVVGNTVIDALQWITGQAESISDPAIQKIMDDPKRLILVTAHRRENFGKPLEDICKALLAIAQNHDVRIVYPVHLNPNVRSVVFPMLGDVPNITLTEPLDYMQFAVLLKKATLILTDSGGIQEEAPHFGIPVLVLRETTERPEAIEAGTAKLVGTDASVIIAETDQLLTDQTAYDAMANRANPFGDGTSSRQIRDIVRERFSC